MNPEEAQIMEDEGDFEPVGPNLFDFVIDPLGLFDPPLNLQALLADLPLTNSILETFFENLPEQPMGDNSSQDVLNQQIEGSFLGDAFLDSPYIPQTVTQMITSLQTERQQTNKTYIYKCRRCLAHGKYVKLKEHYDCPYTGCICSECEKVEKLQKKSRFYKRKEKTKAQSEAKIPKHRATCRCDECSQAKKDLADATKREEEEDLKRFEPSGEENPILKMNSAL